MVEDSFSRNSRLLTVMGMVVLACLVGASIPFYIRGTGDGVARLLAFPALIALGFLFFFSRNVLFLLIIFFRAVCDPVFEATRFGAGSMGIGGVVNALIILIAFLYFLERPRAISRTVIPMWGPLMAVVLFGALRAPEFGPGAKYFLVYLSYAAVFAIPFYLKECRTDMGFAIRLVMLSSVLPALYGFVDFANGGGTRELAGRISSSFEHPNIFAFYLVFMISLALYLLKTTVLKVTTAQRWLLVAYMAVLVLLLMLTKTRSAWAAGLVIFAVYGLMFERKFLVYLAVGGGLLLLVPAVQDRLLDLAQGNEQVQFGRLNSYAWRKSIWEAGLSWMKPEYLPIGYGLESFPYYASVFFPMSAERPGAHSVYVQWFFEAGIVGVACSAWLFHRLFSMLRLGLSRDRLGTVLLITIVLEYLVMAFSDNMLAYLSFNWYFWFLMGAACAVRVAGGEAAGKKGITPGPVQTGVPVPGMQSPTRPAR